MVDETEDPAQETMSKVSRLAVTAASMGVQALARQREQHARDLEEAETERARQLQSRWDAEQAAAQAQVASADGAWLDRAIPQDVAGAWQTAAVWTQFEPDLFRDHEARLAAEIERRYGIDARLAGSDGLDVTGDLHALADAERAREREHEEAARAAEVRTTAADVNDEIGASIVLGSAVQEAATERAAELGAATPHTRAAGSLDVEADGVAYDSDAHRAALADRAAAAGAEPDAVNARLVASNANGKPSQQATLSIRRVTGKPRAPQAGSSRDIGLQR